MEEICMTQEEKDLLLKDLCARLPYGVFVADFDENGNRLSIPAPMTNIAEDESFYGNLKPYLRPMSSMTKEEASDMLNTMFPNFCILSLEIDKIEKDRIRFAKIDAEHNFGHMVLFFNKIYSLEQIDWLNEHHFDYRGLIEKGLALEVPEGMYNTK